MFSISPAEIFSIEISLTYTEPIINIERKTGAICPILSVPLSGFVLGIIQKTAKRMPEMSDFPYTPERTRATYIAVIRTHKRHLARAHTTYLAATRTNTRPQFVCEPSWIIFFSYVQVSFFLWGFFEAKN
jgi:hypothetical protein